MKQSQLSPEELSQGGMHVGLNKRLPRGFWRDGLWVARVGVRMITYDPKVASTEIQRAVFAKGSVFKFMEMQLDWNLPNNSKHLYVEPVQGTG